MALLSRTLASAGSRNLGLKIAIVQFSPILGRVEQNIQYARRLTACLEPRSVDLVCFPEMAFTGYMFPNSASILPYLEKPRLGPTSQFCEDLAKRLECYVTAGYPELLAEEEERGPGIVGANSAVIYGPEGVWLGDYRKSNLWPVDIPWAKPGPGFKHFILPEPLGTLAMGICMDMNPATPEKEDVYELTSYSLTNRAKILVLLCAWKDSGDVDDQIRDSQTLNYWYARSKPLFDAGFGGAGESEHDETILVICNRTGVEEGVQFAGTSAIIRFSRKTCKVDIIGVMSRTEEGVRIWTV